MARYNPVLGPRTLQCVKAIKRDRALHDPHTGHTGRCGECRSCWRLFVWQCKQVGVLPPEPYVKDGIQGWAGFKFMRTRSAERQE